MFLLLILYKKFFLIIKISLLSNLFFHIFFIKNFLFINIDFLFNIIIYIKLTFTNFNFIKKFFFFQFYNVI